MWPESGILPASGPLTSLLFVHGRNKSSGTAGSTKQKSDVLLIDD